MNRVFSFVFLFSLLIVLNSNLQAQFSDERMWSTQIRPTGELFDVPQSAIDYVHPNTDPRVFSTPLGTVVIGPNFRVFPSTYTQSETPITRHPTNPNIMYGSSNSVKISPFTISEGLYLTTDGGTTWFGNDKTLSNPTSNHGGDPAPGIDANGRLYMSHLGYTTVGMFVTNSSDMGTTWANDYTIVSGSQDKNHTVVDNIPTSPFFGRVYVSWSRFTSAAPPIAVSYSSNSGTSWSVAANINTPPASHYSQGVNGAIGPNGEVYMVWQNPTLGSPYTGDFMGFGKSTNGGATWTVNNNIYDCNGIRGYLFATSIRVNDFPWMGVDVTGGAQNGWIYVVHAEKNLAPAGSDADIILHRSTDGGTTWSAGIRVNQDALNNGKVQYCPALVVGGDGSVNVVYYDNRNLSGDSATVYLSRSTDGGNTWTDLEVADHHFKPKPIAGLAGGYQGDYIGVTEANGIVWPYWCDDKSGIYQAWTTKVDFNGVVTNPNIVPALTLTPNTGNGIFDISYSATNNETTSQTFNIWVDEKQPNNRTKTIINRTITVNPGATFNKVKTRNISTKPLGTYTYTLNVGTYPSTIWASDVKTYSKTVNQLSKGGSDEQLIPESVLLESNYPNPFNPSTTIRFGLSQDDNVSLKIFNALGQEVATLVNEFRNAGYHDVVWNGTDNSGNQVTSGIYFYRLSTGSFVEVKKMLLTK